MKGYWDSYDRIGIEMSWRLFWHGYASDHPLHTIFILVLVTGTGPGAGKYHLVDTSGKGSPTITMFDEKPTPEQAVRAYGEWRKIHPYTRQ